MSEMIYGDGAIRRPGLYVIKSGGKFTVGAFKGIFGIDIVKSGGVYQAEK